MKITIPTYNRAFAEDVLKGLTDKKKHLSSRYFYDDEGSHIFQQIMKMPEYYLTRCEMDIFTSKTAEIALAIRSKQTGDSARM